MFEQSILSEPKDARKPYSMLLSLLLQILVIGVLCLLPFVFTQVLPTMQLKDVLAAPPKPPAALKARMPASSVATAAPRVFHLSDLLVRAKPSAARITTSLETANAPSIEGAVEGGPGDTGGIPFAMGTAAPPPAPPPVAEPKAQKQGPIRVNSISAANIIHMVKPDYPAIAKASRLQGSVEFTATISKEGTIENLQFVRGHPLFVRAATAAVMQWRYRPTLLNGQPVEVITDIVVNFNLSQ